MSARSSVSAPICRRTRRRSSRRSVCRCTTSSASSNGSTPVSSHAVTPMEADVQTRRRLGTALGAVAIGAAATVSAAAQAPTASGETTFDRVRRTGVLRIAALPGEMPFFRKDLSSGEWSGVAIDMAKSIATTLGARLEYIESTYGNSVLDLQANKIDLAFALNPTPQRALAIGFTRAYYMHP